MKKTVLASLALGTLLFGTSAHADLIESKFGTGTGWIEFQAEHSPGVAEDEKVGPGGGGQPFDAEYLLYKVDSTKLYIGMQTGFDIENGEYFRTNDNLYYYAGDLALSFDNDQTTWEYAVDFGLITKDYTDGKDGVGGEVGGEPSTLGIDDAGLYNELTWNTDSGIYYQNSNPFAMQDGKKIGDIATAAGSETAGGKKSYWRTIELSLSDLVGISASDGFLLSAHWTMSCGNDEMNGFVEVAPVPEPATMLLFGTGLAGLAGISRRRKKQA